MRWYLLLNYQTLWIIKVAYPPGPESPEPLSSVHGSGSLFHCGSPGGFLTGFWSFSLPMIKGQARLSAITVMWTIHLTVLLSNIYVSLLVLILSVILMKPFEKN